MGGLSKSFALILSLIMVISCLSLGIIKPASAQSIPPPLVPKFTVKFVPASYSVTTTDPYTGVNTTTQVDNSTIKLTIKNQPFDYPSNYHLYYDVRTKPHFGGNWSDLYAPFSLYSGSNLTFAQYISTVYYSTAIPESNSPYTTISYSGTGYPTGATPSGGEIDFEVAAEIGINSTFWSVQTVDGVPILENGQYEPAIAYVTTSGWSNTETVTIPAFSTSASPTPTVPEFPSLVILPSLIIMLFVVVILRLKPKLLRLSKHQDVQVCAGQYISTRKSPSG